MGGFEHERRRQLAKREDPIPPDRGRVDKYLPIALLLLAACLPYLNSFENSFHFDDSREIVDNEGIRSFHNLLAAQPAGRWLTYATYYVNYSLHGLAWMPGWHAFNILLHAGCVLALYGLLGDLLDCDRRSPAAVGARGDWFSAAFCGALLFAVHPLASEAVNYLQSRCVLMYTLFALLATRCALRWYRCDSSPRKWAWAAATMGLVVLASISKPVGLCFAMALPALYFLAFVLPNSPHRKRFVIFSAVTVIVSALVIAAWLVAGNIWEGITDRFNGDLLHYFWAQMIIFWRYLTLAMLPLPGRLNVDHAIVYRPYGLWDADVFIALIAIVLVIVAPAAYLVRKRPAISFLLLAIPLGLLPYFVLTSLEAMVEYRFYLPLAALCGLMGMAASLVIKQVRTSGIVVFSIFIVALALGTFVRNAAWRSELSLWADAVKKSPRKARTVNSLAWAHLTDKEHGDPQRGLELARQSLDPRFVDLPPIYNPYMVDTLAEAYFVNGDVAAAIQIEQTIIEKGVGDIAYFSRQLDRYTKAKK